MPLSYTETQLSAIANLNGLVDGQAKVIGKITGAGEVGNAIQPVVALPNGATGTIDFYLIESIDDVEWTDGIDPASVADVLPYLEDAHLLDSVDATYNATYRAAIRPDFYVSMLNGPKHIAIIAVNNSGANLPSSGHSGNSQAQTVS